ncbi:MAG: KDGP aldolase, partial [Sporomusa sp.]
MPNPVIQLNVLAKDLDNAKEIAALTNDQVYVGVMVKNFDSVDAAVQCVQDYQAAQVPVSVGLGAGDPTQWRKVVEVALKTKPVHVNQVFPAAGYTKGALDAIGSPTTIVNALIAPSGTPGKVSILTGSKSQSYQQFISCEAAAALLQEIGI